MGLNFRKSISILPGVKLNLSKGGVSVSAGVKGLRGSLNSKGQLTTTASIPGTGIYYTKKKKIIGAGKSKNKDKDEEKAKSTAKKNTAKETKSKKAKTEQEQTPAKTAAKYTPYDASQDAQTLPTGNSSIPAYQPPTVGAAAAQTAQQTYQPSQTAPQTYQPAQAAQQSYQPAQEQPQQTYPPVQEQPVQQAAYTPKQLDSAALKAIHKTADDTIDWPEILASETAPDDSYNQEMWSYYHEAAEQVIAGDIDTYLRLIYEVNPLEDLIEYGSNFEFGTDNPGKMEVEFTVNRDVLTDARRNLNQFMFNDLVQDFVCSLGIRIARDIFALLPVNRTIVHAVLDDTTVLSVDFDRETLSKVKFGMIDPSDTVSKFPCNMSYNMQNGFSPVERLH